MTISQGVGSSAASPIRLMTVDDHPIHRSFGGPHACAGLVVPYVCRHRPRGCQQHRHPSRHESFCMV